MRKLITVLLVMVFSFSAVWAQKKSPFAWLRKTEPAHAKLKDINISRQLDRRMKRTFEQAVEAQAQLPADHRMNLGEPISQICNTWEMDPQQIYPQHTFLKTKKQTAKFFAARSNRLLLQEMRRMKGVWAQIDRNADRLRAEADSTPQPSEPVMWLADILPPQTTQFFVGEVHLETDEIQSRVARLLHFVRKHQPDREIILFTEFLPEDFKWTGRQPSISEIPEKSCKYYPIWNSALQAQVKVIGLEKPEAVDDHCRVFYQTPQGKTRDMSAWASLEGVRLRNESWKKTLARYRAKHPDALFIIYTGANHSLYNLPFTLSDNPAEHNFVAVFSPDQESVYKGGGWLISNLVAQPVSGPLERLVKELNFQHNVVQWQSPDLPQIAGFDVRIKVHVELEGINY